MDKADIRVLLVDDIEDFRDLFSVTLELLGYSQIKEAVDGQHALELAKNYQPHLVLMDTRMPDLYGTEVCRQMRQGGYENTAIVGMSDDPDPELKNAWIQAGADDFLNKSILSSRDDLDRRILAALEKYQ